MDVCVVYKQVDTNTRVDARCELEQMLPSVPTNHSPISMRTPSVMRGLKFDIILEGSFPACSGVGKCGEPGNVRCKSRMALEGEVATVERYSFVGSRD